MKRTADLRAIATAVGVHPSTVSRALNPETRHLIRPDLVERIKLMASDFGYRRDLLAAGLRTRRSMLIGIVVPDIANPGFAPIIGGIETVLATRGYAAIVANAGLDEAHQLEIVERLIGRRVDGLILATARRSDSVLTACLQAGVATVLVNRTEADQRVSSVTSDDRLGMRIATNHLIELGHRRIGHVAGPAHLSTGHLRRLGFEEALAAARLPPRPDDIMVATAFTRAAGLAAGRALLERSPYLTAVACANDLLALGLYAALKERQLVCPRDVSVIGHNDMPLVDLVDPPLTTIAIGHGEMGEEAATLLLARLADAKAPAVTLVLEPELVVRQSTLRLR